mmetsp:Transcript_50212/g.95916  ORF Transcript_50212/g.95916 Transcript_50212/m.95916 type:complete len:416 (-) Transcript_50212:219-1466(-)|eukprot:CAMPEP_0114257984 /NCGR_PEP_ID=MMETSP0058-20121206/19049_1 /TAXON_ID=36894 /ORGANISM="Pyramimonas parkeae, CCMP726" /LENGTH=415 /DNA_ID=CAMNT_0001372797 /DNA_START=75 /DNA_END=1322 /DNA_ORIENTATION=-
MTAKWGEMCVNDDQMLQQIPSLKRPAQLSPVKVVILAGSFGQRLAKQIREQGPKGPHANLALGDPPGLAVGLLPAGTQTVLEHLLLMMQRVDRLMPVDDNVYVVVPKAFLAEYQAVARKHQLLPPENIISNGLEAPEGATSALKDLQLAIDHFAITCSVVAVSAHVAFFQDYNFQRVVEHCAIWKKDVCAYSRLVPGEFVMEAGVRPPLVELDNANKAMAKVAAVHDKPSSACNSANALVPLVTLQAASLALVKEFNDTSPGGRVVDFVKWLSERGNTELYAVDLQFGVVRTHSLEHYKHAEAFLRFYQGLKDFEPSGQTLSSDLKSSLTFKDERLAAPVKTPSSDPRFGYMPADYVDMVQRFLGSFFREQNNPFSGSKPTGFTLPTSFYMTTYKRQTSHAETGKTFPLASSLEL